MSARLLGILLCMQIYTLICSADYHTVYMYDAILINMSLESHCYAEIHYPVRFKCNKLLHVHVVDDHGDEDSISNIISIQTCD